MLISCGFDIVFDVPAPTPMVLALYLYPWRANDIVSPPGRETISVTSSAAPGVQIPTVDYFDTFGNRLARIVAPGGELSLSHRMTVMDPGQPDVAIDGLVQHPVQDLPPEVLQFLLGSRYCEVDRFMPLAWELFGKMPMGWQRAKAAVDFAHQRITFGYAHARPDKTAWDAYNEQKGVCRDYQHLAITLCRCLNIPARYVTGYLGDIGVPYDPAPMDFSAWMEVYLGGAWRTMDARHNKPRIGRILMATGRDATDVALTTSFGPTTLKKFSVVTEEMKAGDKVTR